MRRCEEGAERQIPVARSCENSCVLRRQHAHGLGTVVLSLGWWHISPRFSNSIRILGANREYVVHEREF